VSGFAALRDFEPASDRSGSNPELAFFVFMSASAGCGHWQKRALAEESPESSRTALRSLSQILPIVDEMLHRSE
jgi:hypothetical protein